MEWYSSKYFSAEKNYSSISTSFFYNLSRLLTLVVIFYSIFYRLFSTPFFSCSNLSISSKMSYPFSKLPSISLLFCLISLIFCLVLAIFYLVSIKASSTFSFALDPACLKSSYNSFFSFQIKTLLFSISL